MATFEELVNENLALRKALNLARLGFDKTEADFGNLRELYEALQGAFQKLANEHERQQLASQASLGERLETQRFLEARVEELRQAVEAKQNEI